MSDTYSSDQGPTLPDGFSFEPPKRDLNQPASQMQPQQPVNQTDWRGMLDQMSMKPPGQEPTPPRAITEPPADPRSESVFGTYQEPTEQRQAGAWRNMFEELVGVKSAEAKSRPTTSETPAQPGDPASGTTRQGPDGPEMWDLQSRSWMPFRQYSPPPTEGKTGKARKPTGAEKHQRSVSEYDLKLWEEAQRHKAFGAAPESKPDPWINDQGDINWNRAFDPKHGIFPLNVPAINRQLTAENLKRMKEGFQQIDKAIQGQEPSMSAFERWGALLGGGLNYGTGMQAVDAAARSLLGQPLENITGMPKEYTEMAISLGIPGIGFARSPALAGRGIAMQTPGAVRGFNMAPAVDPWNIGGRALPRSQYRTLQKEASIDPLVVGEEAATRRGLALKQSGVERQEATLERIEQKIKEATKAGQPTNILQQRANQISQSIYADRQSIFDTRQERIRKNLAGMDIKPMVPGYRPEGQTLQAMQWAQKTFSPETAGPTAQDASAVLREWLGMGEREVAQAQDLFQRGTMWGDGASFYKQVERSGDAPANSAYKHIPGWNSKDELAAYLDGSPKAVKPDPDSPMGVIAYKTRQALEKTTKEWKKTLSDEQQEYVRDKYLKHKWKNWTESGTGQAAEGRGGGPLAGAKMHERSEFAKDYAQGRENGLRPAFDNPLDSALDSIIEMRRDITQHNVLEEGKLAGTVREPDGPMADALMKNGYVSIAGQRGLYAPENWARIYNNFYDTGFQGGARSFVDAARHFTNANTQFLLGLSMYHAFTMGEALMGTQLARVFGNMGHQGIGKTFLDALEVPFAPLTYYGRGMKAQTANINEFAHPEAQRAISFLTRANWRPMGSSAYTPDIAMSAATQKLGTFAEAARRGTLGKELYAGRFLSNMGRVADQMNSVLFKTYIPRIKAGVNLRRMQDVLEHEPGLSDTEYLERARGIVDSTDNRFGEMVQDNIGWNRGLKQSLMLGMLSYSWTMGGAREWGGGGRDIARWMTGQAVMSPKAQYVIASSMIWGLMNTFAMKMHTGYYPWDEPTFTDPDGGQHKVGMWESLMGYHSGGWVQRYIPPNPTEWGKPFAKGERVWEPEQGRVPGYMKDIVGYMHHPLVELEGKIGSGVRNVWELGITGKDYFDRPIFEPRQKTNLMDQIPRWAKNAWDHMVDQSFPITLQNLGFGGKRLNPMTGLNNIEVLMGMQPAQTVLSNPYLDITDQYFKTKKWDEKQGAQEAAKRREDAMRKMREKKGYGGVNP